MDINSLLPLLMQRNGAAGNNLNTLLKFAQGEKPDINTVMSMAMETKKKNAATGLRPVIFVASHSILGKLCKWVLS